MGDDLLDGVIWIDEHDVFNVCDSDNCTRRPTTVLVAVHPDGHTIVRWTCAAHLEAAVPDGFSQVEGRPTFIRSAVVDRLIPYQPD